MWVRFHPLHPCKTQQVPTLVWLLWICGLPRWHQWWRTSLPMPQTYDTGLIPGSGSSPGGGRGNPLQYSCLENPMDRGAWWAAVHRVTKSWTWLKQLNTSTHTHTHCIHWKIRCRTWGNFTFQRNLCSLGPQRDGVNVSWAPHCNFFFFSHCNFYTTGTLRVWLCSL